MILAAILAGAVGAARTTGPGCNAYIRGEDYNSTVDIGGCHGSITRARHRLPGAGHGVEDLHLERLRREPKR